jgi:hypothetical protein
VGFRLVLVSFHNLAKFSGMESHSTLAPYFPRPAWVYLLGVQVRLEVEVEVEGITRRTTRKEGRKMVRYRTHTY